MRSTLIPAVLACALAAGPALAQGAATTGAVPQGGAGAPAVVAVPAAPGAGGVVGVVTQPAPGVVPGAPLPVGPNGPITAGMEFGGLQPASGRNSFTMVQARRRIAAAGFTNVSALSKDAHGVWRGRASRGGTPTSVWLDYTGKVGTVS